MFANLQPLIAGVIVVALGAYAGAVADRFSYWFHVSRSLLWRKHCPQCFSPQAWMTAVPVCGYVVQRGTCLSCKALLPLQPVVTEIIGAAAAWGLYVTMFDAALPTDIMAWVRAAMLLIALCGMLVLAISDLVYDEVPVSAYVATAAALLGALYVADGYDALLAGAIGSFAAGILMYILAAVSQFRWVHAHDILLALLIGFIVGWPAIMLTLAFAYIFAVIGGLLQWGFRIHIYRGASSFGLYLFVALALQGILSAFSG